MRNVVPSKAGGERSTGLHYFREWSQNQTPKQEGVNRLTKQLD
jgi:hypothetical protein